jgi:hypothetical protein
MTDSILPPKKRFDFLRLREMLLHPRQAVQSLASDKGSTWLTPMLVWSLTFLLFTIAAGALRARAAAMGEPTLPADWQWYTSDMQKNYLQAVQTAQGPVFLFVIPLVTGPAGIWAGWVLLAGILHLLSTLMGGRGSMTSALNAVAWASLPFAARDLLRVVFMLIAGHTLVSPGLSGFAGTIFFAQLLKGIDLFLVWYGILLVLALQAADNLPLRKSAIGVTVVLLVVLLAKAGLGTLTASLSGIMIYRPF